MGGSFWDKAWDKLSAEWRVIKQAWQVFAIAQIIIAVAIWAIVNWHFSGVINDQSALIQFLLQKASNDVQPSQAQVPGQPQGRRLTDQQKTCLIGGLSSQKDIQFVVTYALWQDEESDAYANDFFNVFERVGIGSVPTFGGLQNPSEVGIMLAINDSNHPSSQAQEFKEILQNCGLSSTYISMQSPGTFSTKKQTFFLVIGPPSQL